MSDTHASQPAEQPANGLQPIVQRRTYLDRPAITREYRKSRSNPHSLRVIVFHWLDTEELTAKVIKGDGRCVPSVCGCFVEHVAEKAITEADVAGLVSEWITGN